MCNEIVLKLSLIYLPRCRDSKIQYKTIRHDIVMYISFYKTSLINY